MLEHFTLASFFSLACCLWVGPGAYPRVEHPKDAALKVEKNSVDITIPLKVQMWRGKWKTMNRKLKIIPPFFWEGGSQTVVMPPKNAKLCTSMRFHHSPDSSTFPGFYVYYMFF